MDKIIRKLENKWNAFETDIFYLKQCDTSNNKKQSYLNILFNAANEDILKKIQDDFSCEFHPELKCFYKRFNGIMLFSESLRI